ncbi:hypothetical protein HK100_000598 [Physocladia obscura]|uniref:DNA primase large subunit n=1 Tax=Physocladia obscura TaxID=109957 RepID=A0AAD5TDS5_9FUNG|nr:hypothetical protein HK100_000598 [Physocladia obscura]
MNNNTKRSRTDAASRKVTTEFPFRLNWYSDLPTAEVSLADFETYALNRLKVLKAIENASVRNRNAEDTKQIVRAACEKYLRLEPNHPAPTPEDNRRIAAQRRMDQQSHFILRLAFCRTEDNRAWFVKHETALFKFRYDDEMLSDREIWISQQSLSAAAITSQERAAISADLTCLFPSNFDMKFYKVPFEHVLSLVARRAVVVKNGFAYVPGTEYSTLVTNAFKSSLTTQLESFARALPRMDEDDRLVPILNSIARQCAMRDYTGTEGQNGDTLTANDIDGLVPQGHFPLCMSNLHAHLKADGHLKHSGRLQFGLFLKGTGLPLEEALVYWRRAFNKLTDDKFSKEYAYNIRFNYGKEGSRKDYAPYSCSKIIMSNHPAAGDHHGCPFRHATPESLKGMVLKAGASEAAALDIARLSKEGHYQIACTKLFEVTRAPAIARARIAVAAAASASGSDAAAAAVAAAVAGGNESVNIGIVDIIEHPNQWFDMSYRGTDAGKRRGAKKQLDQDNDGGAAGPMDIDR